MLLDPLGPTGDRRYRRQVFDFRLDEAATTPLETAPADAILVLDGVFLLRRELIDLWDFSVLVAASFAETQRRAEERDLPLLGDAETIRHRYAARYVPGQRIYFAEAHPQDKADAVIDNENPDRPVLRLGERA